MLTATGAPPARAGSNCARDAASIMARTTSGFTFRARACSAASTSMLWMRPSRVTTADRASTASSPADGQSDDSWRRGTMVNSSMRAGFTFDPGLAR